MAAAVLILLTACGAPAGTDEREPAAPTAPAVDDAPPASPQYSIIGTSPRHADGDVVYYVAINPVDLSSDGFKQDVRQVLEEVARTDGDPEFSARVFDDASVASEALADHTNPGVWETPEEMKAAQERRGQHLVAIYSGGLSTTVNRYEIDWYPAAFADTPNVGHFTDYEKWKPMV